MIHILSIMGITKQSAAESDLEHYDYIQTVKRSNHKCLTKKARKKLKSQKAKERRKKKYSSKCKPKIREESKMENKYTSLGSVFDIYLHFANSQRDYFLAINGLFRRAESIDGSVNSQFMVDLEGLMEQSSENVSSESGYATPELHLVEQVDQFPDYRELVSRLQEQSRKYENEHHLLDSGPEDDVSFHSARDFFVLESRVPPVGSSSLIEEDIPASYSLHDSIQQPNENWSTCSSLDQADYIHIEDSVFGVSYNIVSKIKLLHEGSSNAEDLSGSNKSSKKGIVSEENNQHSNTEKFMHSPKKTHQHPKAMSIRRLRSNPSTPKNQVPNMALSLFYRKQNPRWFLLRSQ